MDCPLNKNVGNVEEEDAAKEADNLQGSVEVDAGGVFWINPLENECRQCEEFKCPKKTVRADNFWMRRRAIEAEPVRLNNRLDGLAASEEEERSNRYSCLASEEEERARQEGRLLFEERYGEGYSGNGC